MFRAEPPTFEQHPTNACSGSGSLAGVRQKAEGPRAPHVPADKHRHVLNFGHVQSSQENCSTERAAASARKAERRRQGLQIQTVYLFKINLQSDAEIVLSVLGCASLEKVTLPCPSVGRVMKMGVSLPLVCTWGPLGDISQGPLPPLKSSNLSDL